MQNTNLNTSPYFDDFDSKKNFYKVLFRPGYPVQARELTTSQSILQHQVENFGKSIYKDGSVVIPGQIGYDVNYSAIKINPTFAGSPVEAYRNSLVGLTIKGATSNVTAIVVNTLSANDPQNDSGYIVLFVKYINSSSSDNSTITFFDDEDLISTTNIVAGTTTILNTQGFARTIPQNANAIGSSASIGAGVYFIRGYFVDVAAQTIILDAFTNYPNYKVGLEITENVVTPEEDNSLYDNSIGTSNYTAPGAHRFQISTTLVKKDLDDPDTTNFIELLRLKKGVVQKFVDRSAFSEIQKEIARRTYETNGDYYVTPFDIVARENLFDGTNNGVYKFNQTTDQGNIPSNEKLAIQISPGTAFVRGYEVKTLSTTYIDVDKPRETNTILNQNSPNILGNFVEVGLGTTDMVGMFNFSAGPAVVNLHNNYSSNVSSGTGTTIGYARIINVEAGTSSVPTNNSVYKVYLADIEFVGGTGTTYKFSDVKSILQVGTAYANLITVLNDRNVLSGTNSIPIISSGSTGVISGFISNFTSELRVGDILTAGSGSSGLIQTFKVASISSGSSAALTNLSNTSSIAGSYTFTINRPRLENGNNNKLYTILPKNTVKTLNVNSLQVRQQKSNLNITSNTITINLDQGFIFSNPSSSDFVGFDSNNLPLNIINVNCVSPFTSATLTTSGNSGTATVSYSATKNNPVERVKTPKLMQVLEVNKTFSTGGTFGTGLTFDSTNIGARVEDTIISLGVSDAFNIHAVYESTTTDSATIPNFSSSITSFTPGETILGNSSGSLGRIVSADGSKINFVYISESFFVDGETITGNLSGSITTIASLNNGSPNRLSNYTLDNGQRDQIYDFSRIIRNSNSIVPKRKLKIVFDYFDQSLTGDYFSVNSYTGISYNQIPTYKNQSLSDVIDYRLSVKKPVSGLSGSGTVSSPYVLNTTTLDFSSRTSSGINYFNILKSGLSNNFNLSYYLPRIDKLFLTSEGDFKIIKGSSSENPTPPNDLDNAMLIARIDYSPYLYNINGAIVTRYGNKRYTMKEIGDLENRIKNVEYYTQLSLLETDTNRMIITDANGLNRFKNGFLVDNFTDHSKGDVSNQDYECSVDSALGGLRPSHYTTNIGLEFDQTNSSSVSQTGNLLTLPYDPIVSIDQVRASSTENVNPFGVTAWVGNLQLFPCSDDWMDTTTSPIPLVFNSSNNNSPDNFKITNFSQNGFSPSNWDSWQTSWNGKDILTDGIVYNDQNNLYTTSINSKWNTAFGVLQGANQREIISNNPSQSRNQIRVNIAPTTDTRIVGNKKIANTYLPYIRSRNISFIANRLKPKTQFYPFFDNVDVSNYVIPKLIEINMISGTFNVGETVISQTSGSKLLALSPNDGFVTNPYSSTDEILSTTYSNTSKILNHSIKALSSQVSGNLQDSTLLQSNSAIITDVNLDASLYTPGPYVTGPAISVFNLNTDDFARIASRKYYQTYWSVKFANPIPVNSSLVLRVEYDKILPVRITVNGNIFTNVNSSTGTIVTVKNLLSNPAYATDEYIIDIPVNISGANSISSIRVEYVDNGESFGSGFNIFYMTIDGKRLYAKSALSESDIASLVPKNTSYGKYFGRLIAGERLVGEQSGAVAVVTNNRLVTDRNGIVAGSLFIPDPSVPTNLKFSAGIKNFRLISNNQNSISTTTSLAEYGYAAVGVLDREETLPPPRRIDPLAETFVVNSTGGEFITGVDLFFKTADTNNIPVSVQIRTVENGIPTGKVLPFADVTVLASDVKVSDDSSVPTRFNFNTLIYLKENTEYAIVVLSDSTEYELWISKLNELDVLTGATISTQPYTGVLFKSQNGSTWTPDQLSDLKFVLYRAQFKSPNGTALFNNADLTEGNKQILNLQNNSIQMIGGGTTLTILHPNHGMHGSGNSVTISGVISEILPTTLTTNIGTTPVGTGFSTITVVDASQFHTIIGGTGVSSTNPGFIKIDNEIFSYSSISSNTLNILARAQGGTVASGHSSGATVECYNLNGIPLTQINSTNQVVNPSLDTYQINVSSPANSNLNGGGNSIFATQNIQYETFYPQVQTTILPRTSIVSRYKGVSATSVDGSETSYIFDNEFYPATLNANNGLNSPKLISSNVNQILYLNNQKSFTLELNLNNSGFDNLSPVIDLERVSLTTTTNRIRGNINSISTGSTNSVNDQSTAIYITKLVRLDKSATSLKVMFSAWRPTPAIIDVYYKLLPMNSQANIDSVPYTQFSTSLPSASIPSSSDVEVYRDYEFNADNLNFGAFAIKIVMRSSSQALVPVIKDLRVIALT